MGKNKFRMYVDEVGNPDMGNAENPNHRFLSLTGVILSLQNVELVLHPEFEKIKKKYFGHHPDDPVVFHRKELVNRKHPFEALRDINVRKSFDAELLRILEKVDYRVITVVIDKKEHCLRYKTWLYDPYHYCMKILLERYVLFLERNNINGDVMAESRGGREDMRLKKSFRKVIEEGTEYISSDRIYSALTSVELKVKPKVNNIAGLQLADLIAHPSRREILLENSKIERAGDKEFGDRIIALLQAKYDTDRGRMFGKKVLP